MNKKAESIKKAVRKGYAKVASQQTSCCSSNCCCGGTNQAQDISKAIGYSDRQMSAVPEGSNLGLGCGNPVALASLRKGDVVLDLGSGAGFDAFLAAQRVGKTGRVIGVDMTEEMIAKAKENAKKARFTNLEFRLGEIEKLPLEDNSVDVIISNCVINLSPDKKTVFKEAFRVLKTGGRLMVSDLVLVKELPNELKESVEAYVGCIGGAIKKDQYLRFIEMAGFKEVKIISRSNYTTSSMAKDIMSALISITVSARKPLAKGKRQ
jgi:arsenite methyltransferase